MLSVALPATAHAADKPLIAVLPFKGPQSQKAEAVVVRTLRRRATLLSNAKWNASAKKLFAPSHSPEDIQAVADDLAVQVVITGTVKRDGRTWQLSVSVRDGTTGRSRDKLKYPLKGPRVEERTLRLLAEEVSEAFEHTLAALGNAEEQEEPAPPKPKPPRQPAQAQVTPPPREFNAEKPPPPSETSPPTEFNAEALIEKKEKEKERAKEEPAVVAEAPTRRPRWAPYVDVSAGGSVGGRQFDFSPNALPHFQSGVTGGLRVDATVYPFAFTWRRAKGALAGLGLGATFDKPFWVPTRAPDGNSYATSEQRVEGGVRWRFVLYKPIPRPELTVLLGGGLHQFAIDKRIDPATGNPTDAGPPDIGYGYVSFGAGLRLHFAEWASLWAAFDYHYVINPGPVASIDEYGPATAFGVRVRGGLDFFVWRGLKLGVIAFYERMQLSFLGSNPPPLKPGNGEVASSAVDQYFSGILALGYVY